MKIGSCHAIVVSTADNTFVGDIRLFYLIVEGGIASFIRPRVKVAP